MNCIQPSAPAVRDVEVAAVVGLDLVDRGEDLPAHAVLDAGGLVDRQQERRDAEAVDDDVRHAARRGRREDVGAERAGGRRAGVRATGCRSELGGAGGALSSGPVPRSRASTSRLLLTLRSGRDFAVFGFFGVSAVGVPPAVGRGHRGLARGGRCARVRRGGRLVERASARAAAAAARARARREPAAAGGGVSGSLAGQGAGAPPGVPAGAGTSEPSAATHWTGAAFAPAPSSPSAVAKAGAIESTASAKTVAMSLVRSARA